MTNTRTPPPYAYTADWWYRSHNDQDRSVRQHPQMLSGFNTREDLAEEISRMRASGYEIQKILIQLSCPRCQANGQIITRTFKTKPPRRKTCPTCNGDGRVGPRLSWPLDSCKVP